MIINNTQNEQNVFLMLTHAHNMVLKYFKMMLKCFAFTIGLTFFAIGFFSACIFIPETIRTFRNGLSAPFLGLTLMVNILVIMFLALGVAIMYLASSKSIGGDNNNKHIE